MGQGLCIKFGWLRFAAIPIDRGVRWRRRPLFGANKTYRGILAVSLGSALGYGVQGLLPALQPEVWRQLSFVALGALGFAMGAAAMLSELPNSLIKRQMAIAPGAPGAGPAAAFFYLYDQVDFLVGAWLVVCVWVSPTLSLLLWSLLYVVVLHQLISLGWRLPGHARQRSVRRPTSPCSAPGNGDPQMASGMLLGWAGQRAVPGRPRARPSGGRTSSPT